MNDSILLLVEKEQYEEMLGKYHSNTALTFKKMNGNEYRVFNKATGRFHNIELRIDEVF